MEKMGRLPDEVERANPDMTLAEQYRAVAGWRYWQKLRAGTLDPDDAE